MVYSVLLAIGILYAPQNAPKEIVIEDWSNLNRWMRKGGFANASVRETGKIRWIKAKSSKVLDSGEGWGNATLEVDIPKGEHVLVTECGSTNNGRSTLSLEKADGKGGWIDGVTVPINQDSELQHVEIPVQSDSHIRISFRTTSGMLIGQIALADPSAVVVGSILNLLDRPVSQWSAMFGPGVAPKNRFGSKHVRGGGPFLNFEKGDIRVSVGFSASEQPVLINFSLKSSTAFKTVAAAAGLPLSATLGEKTVGGIFTKVIGSGTPPGWTIVFIESNPKGVGQLILNRRGN